ncbi:hypothetical protein [Burkholderia vietnamiensis]|uniref:hypothetical protein n=1 Tax=Burkholderia vietnamiensis TaxID=60552 RepID=UPI001592B26A|nr:hypothetical protein [Burkholderia vietnamiensis]
MSNELSFPIKSPALRRHMMRHDMTCPECGDQMDVGYECNGCGFDGMPEMDAARTGAAHE